MKTNALRCRTLFGGPSQPEPTDPRGGIRKATLAAEKDESTVNPNQYENPLVLLSHEDCMSMT